MFSVHLPSQFIQEPRKPHWLATLHIIRYLKHTSTAGLFFSSIAPLTLTAFCDADWAACKDTRHSVTGFCIYLGSTPISWKSKKQTTVSRSSAEAEYKSMTATVGELQWIAYLLRDFNISKITIFPERTKHLEIDCHVVKDKVREGFIQPLHMSSKDQVADMFTKILSYPLFHHLCSKLGLIQLTTAPT